jgi:chemotaxis protein methyltransferase CheR
MGGNKGGKSAAAAPRRTGMSDKDFSRFSQFIYQNVGIKLPPSKKTMIEARLQKRLRILKIATHDEYINYLFSKEGMELELINLIDVVTTNTTDFFREPQHFDILARTVLPEWVERHGRYKTLKIWSAGCSTGMEPYTLAIVLSEFEAKHPGFKWQILATDISTQALQTAVRAVYDEARIEPVPKHLKTKYFLRSKDRAARLVRVAPEQRRAVEFRRLNFMEEFSFREPLHIIFCRNVVIYFDKPTQERLFNKFCTQLAPGGFLFIGHSESLSGMTLPLKQVAPTVYRRL